MQTRTNIFSTIRTEGMLLPTDLLQRIASGSSDLDGLRPTDYHLAEGEKLNEAISRSWNRLLGLWETFYKVVEETPDDFGIGITRSRWLLPLFQELGYGTLPRSKVTVLDGKEYPVSHFHGPAPIHLVGFGIGLDKRTAGAAGAARISPHGLLQEFLNRSEPHLWGFVSNGYCLRILRDNVSLTRQAYVEFDIKSMMEGEVYSDFVLLWMLCHQSRIETEEGKTPDHCWLEKWSKTAQQQGTRALENLRNGVEKAITALGSGFLACRSNAVLKQKLQSGELDKQDYYRHLLRIVYRLIFLFTAEDRDLLLLPDTNKQVKDLYTNYYSTQRLRKLAQKTSGTQHCDLYESLSLIFEKLDTEGCSELGIPALGSFLWSKQAIKDLVDCDISNRDLLDCIRALAFTVRNHSLIAVDYKNIGSEELGSIYESLLELHPDISADAGTFELKTAGGHERKTTGSYYTPTCLITCLLDSALEPVIKEALKKPNPEKAVLGLKICDPACGSGHFLVAAAHRIAKRLAAVRTGDEEPSPEALRTALRDVIGHCIYGVDINPMSVELCKISLWLEAIEPGKPLSFLDHHIKCGNSLLGTTPALMGKGIPDDAFKPIEGDVKAVCNDFKRQNRDERRGQRLMLFDDGKTYAWDRLGDLTQLAANLDALSDDNITSLEQKRERYEQLVKSAGYEYGHLLADLWCAAFVIRKNEDLDYAITENIFRDAEKSPHSLAPWLKAEAKLLAEEYQFFHWYLEFPSVFQVPGEGEEPDNEYSGLCGGFDCVLGNPPWERIKLQEKEFFASLDSDIANAPNAARRRAMIAQLPKTNPALFAAFQKARRKSEGDSHMARNSGYYPLCGRGDINTYSIFAELKRNMIGPTGRVGCIVPSGIATDDTTKFFFQDLMDHGSLASLYDFENREGIFPEVHRSQKFCILTLTGKDHSAKEGTDFVFFATNTTHLLEKDRHFTLTSEEIALLNPNTKTCPIFRSKIDAELTKYGYRRTPVLIDEGNSDGGNLWGIQFLRMFDMANDSNLFHTSEELEARGLRCVASKFISDAEEFSILYEGKMFNAYNSRFADVVVNEDNILRKGQSTELAETSLRDPKRYPLPHYWVSDKDIEVVLPRSSAQYGYLAYKGVTSPTNERTMICTWLPWTAIHHNAPIILSSLDATITLLLTGNLNAFAYDFILRNKANTTYLSYFYLRQVPVVPPKEYQSNCPWLPARSLEEWMRPRVLELCFHGYDLEPLARKCGYSGTPFVWDRERRLSIRSELDSAYFHLYLGTKQEWKDKGSKELLEYFPSPRDAVDYIMDTFPIVKRKDEKKYGSYRTKELILEIYDKMTEAIKTGQPCQTILDPPPADPSVAHPSKTERGKTHAN